MTQSIFLFLFACGDEVDPKTKEIVEDTSSDTDNPEEECDITIAGTIPNDGAGAWFYRSPAVVTFSEENPTVAFSVVDSSGSDVPVSFEWDDVRLNASVLPDSGSWNPSENYTLTIDLCGNMPSIAFSTSEIGTPLEEDSSNLIGNTYFIDLSSAEYSEPPGVGTLLSLYLDMPLLLGVSSVESSVIDFEAYLGYRDDVSPDWMPIDMDPWMFSGADFSSQPFFSAYTEMLTIPYGSADIPVHGFAIEGTFASDASSIQKATFTGLGDTSQMGPLMGFGNDPEAVCSLLGQYGISCLDCPDGAGVYCVRLTGDIEQADLLQNVDVISEE
jgi:hypothetical protein